MMPVEPPSGQVDNTDDSPAGRGDTGAELVTVALNERILKGVSEYR